jgi:hypothetical protein
VEVITAAGKAIAVTAVDAGPVPTSVLAVTVTAYRDPLVSPVTEHDGVGLVQVTVESVPSEGTALTW